MAADHIHGDSSSLSFGSGLFEYNFSVKALQQWIVAFVVCDFNVDVGVEVEYMLPHTSKLSASDLSTICFNSFPERNSDTVGDVEFHFRFRHTPQGVVKETGIGMNNEPEYWYGFCLFRQQKDLTVKRHFRQKSLVLVSQHNYASLFRHLVKTVALIDFEVSSSIVESACANIATWSAPEVGHQELPFLGSLLNVHIPPHVAFPLQGLSSPSYPSKLDLSLEITKNIYTSEPLGSWSTFASLLSSPAELYIIFEQAVLCEPLVILADEPNICSEFVSSIVDFIRPIPYSGDFRPYLTLQSDFFNASPDGERCPKGGFIIGVTNPFFLKRLSSSQMKGVSAAHVVCLAAEDTRRSQNSRYFYPFGSEFDNQLGYHANETRGYIAKDWRFIKRVQEYFRGNEMTSRECSDMIRRHFSILAALFLAPLNRYMATLLQSASSSGNMEYAPFIEEEFFESLWKYGCSLQFKGKTSFHRHKNAEIFYRRFCRCKNFDSWWNMRIEMRYAKDLQHNANNTPTTTTTAEGIQRV